jgi:hypothetical protein
MPDFVEGGGRNPPYHESFLENIVNVSWQSTGGVFVSGDFCCYQRYVKIPRWDSPQDWTMLGHLGLSDGGSTFSSTYGKVGNTPVFLIGGNGPRGHAILRSTNGSDWEFVLHMVLPNARAGSIHGLFWDGKMFYASPNFAGDQTGYQCYYSPDGKSWFLARDSFNKYCSVGVLPGVPDGIYGYDPIADVLIGSYKMLMWLDEDVGPTSSAYIIANATSNQPRTFAIDIGLTYLGAVAYVGGIWMAGGFGPDGEGGNTSTTLSSLDGGHSWFVSTAGHGINPFDDQIETIIGAPIGDF